MTAHDWYLENRAAYATRTLDRKEARLFADHLPRCPECQAAIKEIEDDLAWLPLGVQPVAPRPGLTRRLTQRTLHRGGSWRRWIGLAAAAATLAVAIGTWTGARRDIAMLESAVAAAEQRWRAVQDSLSSIVGADRVRQETIAGSGYRGGVLIFYDDDTHWWNVGVHGLPPARAGQVYQLWLLTSRGILPGPELHPDGSHPTFATFRLTPQAEDPIGAKLTLEPVAGPVDRPVGTELASLTF
ncbi:MAG: anti-sigma factor [Gemmatimonadetes bacterium]|nr:anti-sigma factor [Gemmatimonadota bacterium]